MIIAYALAVALLTTPPPTPICDTWDWSVMPPGGAEWQLLSCEQNTVLDLDHPGTWRVRLSVRYAHSTADGMPYTVVVEELVDVRDAAAILLDGFESGTTAAWSGTNNGG